MDWMKRIGRIVIAGLVVAFLGAGCVAASGRYIDVDVEAFESWGFLGLGAWSPVDARLVSLRVVPLDGEDSAQRDRLADRCEQTGTDDAACGLIGQLSAGFVRNLAFSPGLGQPYRVVLTNRTDSNIGVVLEVDGLNTNGGTEVAGTSEDKKWVLRPRETVRIAGWQVSADEALAFEFATPSGSHSTLAQERGSIVAHVYIPEPGNGTIKGTGAAEVISQPTVRIPFQSATTFPVERFVFDYARDAVSLGLLCEESGGTGVRISSVVDGTIAQLRGLRAGDIITFANAVPIRTCADLAAFLGTRKPGDRVVLKVHRTDRVFLLTLELEE